jgi:hypothetical protein
MHTKHTRERTVKTCLRTGCGRVEPGEQQSGPLSMEKQLRHSQDVSRSQRYRRPSEIYPFRPFLTPLLSLP